MTNRSLRNYIELFWEFFWNDFKLRYKRSYLGILWAVLKPLAQFFVLYNIWKIWNIHGGGAFAMLTGIIVFNVFSESFTYGMQSLFYKAHIILKIYFPREIVVFSASVVSLTNAFFNFLVLLIIGWHRINLPFIVSFWGAVILVFFLGTALALWISVNYVKFRDLHHIIDLILYIWFWVTPILYPLDLIKGNVLYPVVKYNPLTNVILFIFDVIQKNTLSLKLLTYPSFLTLTLLICGLIYFSKTVRKVAEYY